MASRSKQQQSLPGLEKMDPPSRSNGSPSRSRSDLTAAPPTGQPCAPLGQAKTAHDTPDPCALQPQAVDIKGWNVYVVDAYSLIFQVFHALPEMSSPRGEQV